MSEISIEDSLLVIKQYNYEIEMSRCSTYEDILAWVLHLSEKTWVTSQIIEEFVKKTISYNKLDYPTV